MSRIWFTADLYLGGYTHARFVSPRSAGEGSQA